MKPKAAVIVLSGVVLGMLGVGMSHTTDSVGNSNTAAGCTEADRRPRKLANGGTWDPEKERLRNIDGNTGRPIMNGSWNANCARWNYDYETANNASNAASPLNTLPHRARRPAGGSTNWNGNVDQSMNMNAVNVDPANPAANTNAIPARKTPPRKSTRRPALGMGGSIAIGDMLGATLLSSVKTDQSDR